MPAHPVISIICCTHNRRAFVATHLAALREELTDQIELVYALDNCTDDSLAYLQAEAGGLSNVRILDYRGPGGLFNCRNFSLDHAHGRYIHFLDDDDSVDPGYHRSICASLPAPDGAPLDAYVTGMVILRDDGSTERLEILRPAGQARASRHGALWHLQADLGALLNGHIYFNCANTLFSRDFFQRNRFRGEIRKSADWLLYLEAALVQDLRCVVDESLSAIYYVHQNSMSIAPDKSNWNAIIFDRLLQQTGADSPYFAEVRRCCAKANFDAGYANRTGAKARACGFYLRAIQLGLIQPSLLAMAKLPFQY